MNEGVLTVPNGGDVACDPFGRFETCWLLRPGPVASAADNAGYGREGSTRRSRGGLSLRWRQCLVVRTRIDLSGSRPIWIDHEPGSLFLRGRVTQETRPPMLPPIRLPITTSPG